MEYNNGHMAIHPSKQKLITAPLRTAVENEGGMLDKEVTSHDGLTTSSIRLIKLSVSIGFSMYFDM